MKTPVLKICIRDTVIVRDDKKPAIVSVYFPVLESLETLLSFSETLWAPSMARAPSFVVLFSYKALAG